MNAPPLWFQFQRPELLPEELSILDTEIELFFLGAESEHIYTKIEDLS